MLGLLAACAAPCDYRTGDTLPIFLRGALPVVPAEVNGQRVPFVLDTGAAAAVLTPEAVQGLNLPPDQTRRTRLFGAGGISTEQNALLASLRIGRQEFRGISLPVAAHSVPGQRVAAGFLGADFLRRSDVEIDIPARRMVLHDVRACQAGPPPWPAGYETIPVTVLRNGWVLLPVEVNGVALKALLDTGANLTAIRRQAALSLGVTEAGLSNLPARRIMGIGPERLETPVYRIGTVRVGGEVLRDLPVIVFDRPESLPFDVVLGLDYIGTRRLWLSYARESLSVQPVPAAAPAPAR